MNGAKRWTRRWLAAAVVAASAVMMWPACGGPGEPCRGGSSGTEPANLNFSLKDMSGKDVRLADFKGRPLIINFWATWCGPCKAEIPVLMDLAEKYKASKLAVLGVSIDDSPADLQQFSARYKINYPLLVGAGHDDMLEAYGAALMVPVSWVIRCDGTVAEKKIGAASREWFETQAKALF